MNTDRMGRLKVEIITLFIGKPLQTFKPNDISAAMPSVKRNTINRVLARLVDDGLLLRPCMGEYRLNQSQVG